MNKKDDILIKYNVMLMNVTDESFECEYYSEPLNIDEAMDLAKRLSDGLDHGFNVVIRKIIAE